MLIKVNRNIFHTKQIIIIISILYYIIYIYYLGETFVEFQRRTGCSLAFNQLYQSITKVLGDNVLNAVNGTPIQQSQNILPEFKVTPLEFDNKIITSLYTSAISPNIDESTEAFRTLASNTTNHSNNVALILSQLHDTNHVPALTEVICSSLALHDDVASRHASAFLANLVSHQNSGPLHSWLISDCLEPLLALNTASSKDLVTSSSGSETFEQDDKEPKFSILLNRETRRQMTKIIHQLSRTYPDITTQASQTSTNTSNDSPQIILS